MTVNKEVHTYVYSNKKKMLNAYDEMRKKITSSEMTISKEIRINQSGDRFETDEHKFVFLVSHEVGNMRGRRTHFLYVDETLMYDDELFFSALAPMLNFPHPKHAKERLFWI
jgi:hypothetical protein